MRRRTRSILAAVCLSLLMGAALFIPQTPAAPPRASAEARPFEWRSDVRWDALEARFIEARSLGCGAVDARVAAELDTLDSHLAALEPAPLPPTAPIFDALEDTFFLASADIAACPSALDRWFDQAARLRALVKRQSEGWDMSARAVRERVYRLLYGTRIAVEEALLQLPSARMPELMPGNAAVHDVPSAMVHGIRVESGDLLVSRGGAPTSALIARGNDFPGNFSHVALVHIDPTSRAVSVIEAHIEVGVTVSSLATYLADQKLRILALRLRPDLDHAIAHRAASLALERARRGHIPYDFAMDYEDDSSLFCSEVASAHYRRAGITLWQGLSTMSSRGVVAWLGAFGVKHFRTHAPADLEYDPHLRVVAEWRGRETLLGDHLDNAVIDAMLEDAERGAEVEHDRRMLPLARIAKAYSALLNAFGEAGPVPEGMSATVALRVDWLRAQHRRARRDLDERVKTARSRHGYLPPYWELVRLAREN